MFINLGFQLNGEGHSQLVPSDVISKERALEIIQYIAQEGGKQTSAKSFAEWITFTQPDISYRVAKGLIIQMLRLRFVCANWMNCNADTRTEYSDDLSGKIPNTTPPNNLNKLKDDAFFTCSRDIETVDAIYTVTSLEELRDSFDSAVELVVSWSNGIGDATWSYYSNKVVQYYDYDALLEQIIVAENE